MTTTVLGEVVRARLASGALLAARDGVIAHGVTRRLRRTLTRIDVRCTTKPFTGAISARGFRFTYGQTTCVGRMRHTVSSAIQALRPALLGERHLPLNGSLYGVVGWRNHKRLHFECAKVQRELLLHGCRPPLMLGHRRAPTTSSASCVRPTRQSAMQPHLGKQTRPENGP